jgi:hypothetical protein
MERSVKYKVTGLKGALAEGICVRSAAERRTKGCARTGGASQDELLLDIREHVRLHMPDPFTCALSEARASRWFAKKRTGIGLLYDVSIKDLPVSNGASVALGDQITSLLGMLKPNAPR